MKITAFDASHADQLTKGVTVGTAGGGDLGGSLPAPTVVGIGGVPVDAPDGIATDYLNGSGHWSTPAGSGGTGFVTSTLGGKEVYQTIAALGAAYTLDLTNGNAFDATLTANCTLTFAGATAGVLCAFELWLRQDGTGGWTTTWPGSVVWPGGTAPTLDTTLSTVTVLGFASLDGGTTWYGFPAHGSGSGVSLGSATPLVESGSGAAGSSANASHDDHVHPASGGGGGGSGIIGVTAYMPGSDASVSAGGSNAAIDATNLAVTFTAPTSGNVILACEAWSNASTGRHYWQPIDGGSNLSYPVDINPTGSYVHTTAHFYITGLSAGSHTIEWGQFVTAGSGITDYGPTAGPATMVVWPA